MSYSLTQTHNLCLAAETKSNGTRKGEAIVRPLGKLREEGSKCPSRHFSNGPNAYIGYAEVTAPRTLQNQDPVLNAFCQRLGVSLRQTEDELTRNMLQSTASFINCVAGTNGDVPTELTNSDIATVAQTLASNDAYTISDSIEGEDRFGTAPVRDAYFVMASTQLQNNLQRVNGFIAKAQYPNQDRVLRPEFGSVLNTRWMLSSIGSFSNNASLLGNTVYNCFVAGMEAYAVIEQDRYSASFIYRPPLYDGPLALNSSIGYKFAQVPFITNDAWIINLRTTIAA